jgi:hypothetical protein
VHNDLAVADDADHISALGLLDLSIVFDTVDHHILLSLLQRRFGIEDVVLRWFISYLYVSDLGHSVYRPERPQFINWHVSCGVRQGSVIGPLEFLM